MNQQLKEAKRTIRGFMREHYTDERLVMLLAHAKDGKLAWYSCCCFIGTITANHALRGKAKGEDEFFASHVLDARRLTGAEEAEGAYRELSMPLYSDKSPESDAVRRRRLIPIIKAELRRRERVRQQERVLVQSVVSL